MTVWDPTQDPSWRSSAQIVVEGLVRPTPWDPSFDTDIPDLVAFMLTRIEALVVGRTRDCRISYGTCGLREISDFDPQRLRRPYPALVTRLRQEPGYEALPIVCARTGGRTVIWDGHHRYLSYSAADRGQLVALIANFKRGTGIVCT